jgi:hypothetical protein
MDTRPSAADRIEAYLAAVAARLAHEPESVRAEVLADLREQAHEALKQAGGGKASPEAADRVLSQMDPPESFGRGGGEAAAPAACGGGEGRRWFLLALAFLALNGYAVWKLTRSAVTAAGPFACVSFLPGEAAPVHGIEPLAWTFSAPASTGVTARLDPVWPGRFRWTSPTELRFEPHAPWQACRVFRATLDERLRGAAGQPFSGNTVFRFASKPLQILDVQQVHLSPERQLTLRVVFNAEPDRRLIPKHLFLSEEGDPELTYELLGDAGSNVVLVATETVARDEYRVRLLPGLPPARGELGVAEEWSRTANVIRGFTFRGLEPETPGFGDTELRLLFSAQADAAGAETRIGVSPPVRFAVEPLDTWRGGGLKLTGPFRAGAVYTVSLKPDLRSTTGIELGEAIVRTVQFPDRPAALTIRQPGRYLSPRASLEIPVAAVNVRRFTAELTPVLEHNLVTLARSEERAWRVDSPDTVEDLAGRSHTVTNEVSGGVNEECPAAVRLRDLCDGPPRGVYHLSLRNAAPGVWQGNDDRLLVVSDLGLTARTTADGVWVWVVSLVAAQPVAGAEVRLFARNGTELERRVTGPEGLVFLPCKPAEGEAPALLLTARLGDDLTFLKLAGDPVAQGGERDGRAYLDAGKLEAALFTARGVYRPGETVHAQALVRDASQRAPEPFPALFRLVRPDGRVYRDLPAMLNAFGAAETELALPDFLPTGRYTLQVVLPGSFTVLGQTAFSLEEFVPPQIRVAVEPPTGTLFAGTNYAFAVSARNLFGGPAAGLRAQGAMSVTAVPFAPAGWQDWSFGDPEKSFEHIWTRVGECPLDGEGRGSFDVETHAAWRPPAALRVMHEVSVTEVGGRSVSGYAAVTLHAYPFYIGLRRATEGALRVGEEQRVRVVALAPDGRPAADAALTVKLLRAEWSSSLVKAAGGRYEWQSRRTLTAVREDSLTAGGQPREYAFSAPAAGEYVLQFAHPASGASASLRLFAAEPGSWWTEWSRERPDRVELTPDRESYRPGDTARVAIKAPFAGLALFTVESDRVLTQRVVRLSQNTAELEVPVRTEYAPNVYCAVTLLRPAGPEKVWSAHRAAGVARLTVTPPDRRLEVRLEAAATNRPSERVTVRVAVTDEAGAAAAGEVVLAATDEAICMLTDYRTPDPLRDVFLAARRHGVALRDLYADLMPIIEEQAAGAARAGGDGGGAESALRKRLNPIRATRFRPVALWAGRVSVGTNGTAEIPLDLPEFSGELRVMALAYDAGRIGSASRPLTVRRALVVRPSLPRFLATGDRCEAAVELHNGSGRDLPVRLRLLTSGPLSVEDAATNDFTRVAAGAALTLRFPLRAGDLPGVAQCAVTAEWPGDAYRETIEMAVRPAGGLRTHALAGVVEPGAAVALSAPSNWLAASVAAEVRVSGMPALRLGRALDYVLHYPYGCLEQTVSGAFPLLYAADLAQRMLPGSAQRSDVEERIAAGVLRVLSMQQSDGSFALWPQMRGNDPAATLYAAHFLVEAQRAGFPVPADRLNVVLEWVEGWLEREAGTDLQSETWRRDMQERAYACHVLALAGRPARGWTARLRESAPHLTYAARTHVAAALMLAGEPREATTLMGGLGLPPERPVGAARGMNDSRTRDAALLLAAWLDADPARQEAVTLARFLEASQRDGHWGNTHDNAMALLALGKYAQRVPEDRRPFTGSFTPAAGPAAAVSSTQDLRWASQPGAHAGPARLTNAGPGRMYYAARYEGVPARGAAEEADNGLRLRRAFHSAGGEPLDPAALRQGDLVIVRLSLDTAGRELDNVVIEELLPAGWEIENPNLSTSKTFGWLEKQADAAVRREIRDDRLLLFTGRCSGSNDLYYAARAVTPGRFVYPPTTAACMYEPEIRSVSGAREVEVRP